MAVRAGVEPTTLRLKVIDSTSEPPRPIWTWTWTFKHGQLDMYLGNECMNTRYVCMYVYNYVYSNK